MPHYVEYLYFSRGQIYVFTVSLHGVTHDKSYDCAADVQTMEQIIFNVLFAIFLGGICSSQQFLARHDPKGQCVGFSTVMGRHYLFIYIYFRLNVYFLQQTILFIQKENVMTQRSYDTDIYAYLLIRVGGEISRY